MVSAVGKTLRSNYDFVWGLLFSTGLSADNAGTGQQSGSAIIPLPVVGTGTALLILVFVFSGPLFEKNSQATAISHF